MSSHREAPEISTDPVADNTDTYAFVSPDRPDSVTILTNYIPLEAAAAGPNFYQFGDDVLYEIHISNHGTGQADIAFQFRFKTHIRDENTFLYNTGTIRSIYDRNFNRHQTYSVTRVNSPNHHPRTRVLARGLASPPCNIGPFSTPDYPRLAQEAVHSLPHGIKVFAGQRNDGFFADLGAVFDLGDVRPLQKFHISSMLNNVQGIDTLKSGTNVHTIALQIPISELTRNHSVPRSVFSSVSTIGIWGSASRRKMQVRADRTRKGAESGPWVQVSRLANPLFNELLVTLGRKDEWNRGVPLDDKGFTGGVLHPELAALLPVLYPGAFPNLARLNASRKPRADIEAIFLTGIPKGIVPGFQNYTGKHPTDMVRVNVAIKPTPITQAKPLGLLGGDPAGFPNGRRVTDDIVTIELKALAGLTYPLIDKTYKPDATVGLLTQDVPEPPTAAPGAGRFLPFFPYLGIPHDGFDTPSS